LQDFPAVLLILLSADSIFEEIFNLFDGLWYSGNIFINKIYKSLLILYYDKFGNEGLKDFAYSIIILFTYFGFEKEQIRKEGVVNNFAKPFPEKINLFNLIFSRYYPVLIKENLDKYIQFEVGDEIKKGEKKKIILEEIIRKDSSRLGSFVSRWHNNEEIKNEVYKILKTCGRNWFNVGKN